MGNKVREEIVQYEIGHLENLLYVMNNSIFVMVVIFHTGEDGGIIAVQRRYY